MRELLNRMMLWVVVINLIGVVVIADQPENVSPEQVETAERNPGGFVVTDQYGNTGWLGDSEYLAYGRSAAGNYGYLGGQFYSVYGYNTSNSFGYFGGPTYGAYGEGAYGAYGYLGGNEYGVYGRGVNGHVGRVGAFSEGVYGYDPNGGNTGYLGNGWAGVFGQTFLEDDNGVIGIYSYHGTGRLGGEYGVYGSDYDGPFGFIGHYSMAAYFSDDVDIDGTLSKNAGSFKIDHPLDPENKYLYHSFVESPDMMNVYNGNVHLDESGTAVVIMPDWFEALNRDFRYQLTAIGAPGPNLYVAEKMSGNRFRIAGGQPGLEVSWQVTGIRHDPYAEAHRIPVEENKSEKEIGKYRSPELYGQPESQSVDFQYRLKQIESETKISVTVPEKP